MTEPVLLTIDGVQATLVLLGLHVQMLHPPAHSVAEVAQLLLDGSPRCHWWKDTARLARLAVLRRVT